MINRLISVIGASFIALVVSGTASNAATLDFTANPFIGANGIFAGTTYSISTSGGSLASSQAQDGNSCVGLACQNDGLGVNNGGGDDDDDEISSDGAQSLTIDFGKAIGISGITFLDLFTDDEGTSAPEVARVTYNGGFMDFSADPGEVRFDGSSGFLSVSGLYLFTDQLVFTVLNGGLQSRGYGDYALASISAVPLPPALLMFGAALGGMGFLGRRRKKASL